MKKFLLISCLTLFAILNVMPVQAQDSARPDEFFKAEITQILDEGKVSENLERQYYQTVKVRFLNGWKQGQEIELTSTNYYPDFAPGQKLRIGDKVIVSQIYGYEAEPSYHLYDRYRINQLYIICGFFVLLAVWLGRKRGFTSLIGLGFSILVLALYIVPQILTGTNPFSVILIGSIVIVGPSLYLAHGFNRQTSVSLLSTVLTLCTAIIMAIVFVKFARLFGMGTEDAYLLITANNAINLQGLLLGGIIIGTLGILDDITTAQTAIILELKRANPSFTRHDLYKRGLAVGHEHIASLVNTLVLAYAGSSLPIFLLFTLNKTQPLWLIFNGEFVAEEIVRTLVGSSTLVLSVPIATWIASWAIDRWSHKFKATHAHIHQH